MAPKTEAELALQRKYEELRKKKVRVALLIDAMIVTYTSFLVMAIT